MKQIAILGSTGSIGCNTLRVIEALKGGFGVAALGAGSNVELLTRQVEQYRPRVVSTGDEECAEKLRYELKRRGVKQPKVGVGVEGLCEVATCDGVEIVIGAVVGARGLLPAFRALELGRRV
ncbi:MAG TPA: 1-deoxy-D-xylulose-5-phosphate reductoisomerase, partial [Blastocatellia bacterium]|nr:1-deoxy-D-xylulose-5-phosphate reductoisomerase [Blastocatellia bacterium]